MLNIYMSASRHQAISQQEEYDPKPRGERAKSRKYNPMGQQKKTRSDKWGENQQRINMAGGGGRKQEVSVVRQMSCDVVMYVEKI